MLGGWAKGVKPSGPGARRRLVWHGLRLPEAGDSGKIARLKPVHDRSLP